MCDAINKICFSDIPLNGMFTNLKTLELKDNFELKCWMYCFLRGFEEKIHFDKNTKIRFLVKFKNAFSQKYHNPILGKIVIEMATCILIYFDLIDCLFN